MYRKQIKRLKWQKIVLVALMTIITLCSTLLPTFATSAGNDGENYPTIPLYLELRYADKSVFTNITDRYYYNNTVNHDSVTVSGRVLTTYLATKSIQADGVLMRKYITSEYDVAPVGFEITAPTFYLTRNEGSTSFNQVRPYILIPDTVNVECVLTYDIFMGGDTPVGTVERAITSPLGQSDNVYLFEFSEIDAFATSTNWKSCRIENLSLNSVTMTFTDNAEGSPDSLGGTWVINEDFDFNYVLAFESVVSFSIPFTSNGKRFTGIRFEDGMYLDFYNDIGQLESIQVWHYHLGWLAQEYRTFYVDSDFTWEDVIPDEIAMQAYDDLTYWQTAFYNWMSSNCSKQTATGGYDGGPLLHWRYQVQTNEYINAYLKAYYNEYTTTEGDSAESYFKGYEAGEVYGFNKGFSQGYQKAVSETNPDLTAWLSVATGGILAFEILPNITLLDMLGIIITIALVIALLKFFAGG